MLNELGFGYEKTSSHVDNCILFYKENKELDKCFVCSEPKYKIKSHNRPMKFPQKWQRTRLPQKLMCYLLLKCRLQWFYKSTHTASHMRWYKKWRVNDDIIVMRHLVKGEALKKFDRMYSSFCSWPTQHQIKACYRQIYSVRGSKPNWQHLIDRHSSL